MRSEMAVPLKLRPGQAAPVYMAQGARLLVTRGEVTIRSWLWLAERMVEQRVTVREGELHIVENDGWVVFETRGGAALQEVVTRPLLTLSSAAFKRVLGRIKAYFAVAL